jgi:predicted RNase H-like HicB family nuclease
VTTLIAVYNSDGCVGRCDARCYDAEWDECDCICGGRNHGAGKQQALDNARELAGSWIERARANGQDITSIEQALETAHEPLFGIGSAS